MVINKPCEVVAASKTVNKFVLVLEHPTRKTACNSRIQHM
jgi:hypothetical protein